jgi:hypothetical protein
VREAAVGHLCCKNPELVHVRLASMLSKKDFWRWSEKNRFKNKPTSRILIHVHLISDSIIAHFGRSQAHRPTFSTASVKNGKARIEQISSA